jgi:hypothetical protein
LSGEALAADLEVGARPEMAGKTIVVVCPILPSVTFPPAVFEEL